MYRFWKTSKHVRVFIEDRMFPTAHYHHKVWAHYLTRDDQVFCCIQDNWWEIKHRWKSMIFHDQPEPFVEIDSIRRVDPPHDVVYSHSLPHEYRYYEPDISLWGSGDEDDDEIIEIVWRDSEQLPFN